LCAYRNPKESNFFRCDHIACGAARHAVVKHISEALRTANRLEKSKGKKNREENKFSSRVEVRGCDSEGIRSRYQALGLNASFSSLIFSLLLSFFSLPSTIPPFQSATCGVGNDFT